MKPNEICERCGSGVYTVPPFMIVLAEPVPKAKLSIELKMNKYILCKDCFEWFEKEVAAKRENEVSE